MKGSKCNFFKRFKSIIGAVLVRIGSLTLIGFSIQYLICIHSSDQYADLYLLLIINAIAIIIEGLYVCIKRDGADFKWYKILKK
jgi:hypothetical protein